MVGAARNYERLSRYQQRQTLASWVCRRHNSTLFGDCPDGWWRHDDLRGEIVRSSDSAGVADVGEDAIEVSDREFGIPDSASRMIRRQRVVIGIAVGAAVLSLAGLVASTFVKSPAQAKSEAGPPKASVLTATVERRLLTDTLAVRGNVVTTAQIEVTPTAPVGAAAPLVTGTRAQAGARLQGGDVAVEVSGRPVIVLAGAVPAYRDLKPGGEGADVAQLQAALTAMGLGVGADTRGHFGPGTKAALTKLYERLGYAVPTTGGSDPQADRKALQAAQTSVDEAQRAVDNMKRQIAAGAGTPSGAPSPGAPGGTPGPSGDGSEPLSEQLRYLQKALTAAKQNQAELVATTGPYLPVAEAVFVPQFPVKLVKLNAKVGDKVTAPLLTLSSGSLEITSELPQDQVGLIKPGMAVRIDAESIGGHATGTVARIGGGQAAAGQHAGPSAGFPGAPTAAPANQQGGSSRTPFTVAPEKALEPNWDGQNVRLTITQASTPAPVLVVPVSALSTSADGRTTVTKRDAAGRTAQVEVKAGLSGDGYVEVIAAGPAQLEAGDTVVVGA
ncbi:peptidoglycan-binding protein [Yinghuangia soli]|uniref:Peptidoglycan-binding protein n=1 Tax=Yinghuangia soli TaxID=2908204 RepID=A0AA41Q0Z1_9ACTN|nr:peptidoglycan-binding protein [Yinghuangia soli]MCF2529549.1 peptidoglycan-binding protein [Yinghuangia soli]